MHSIANVFTQLLKEKLIMYREINLLEASRVSGGFDHLPGAPKPYSPPTISPVVEEWIRQFKDRQMQELMKLLAPPHG